MQKTTSNNNHGLKENKQAQPQEEKAKGKLLQRGFSPADILAHTQAFKAMSNVNKIVLLTNYELLHGINELDNVAEKASAPTMEAEAILGLFRAAEICLNNLTTLTQRILEFLKKNNIKQAATQARWCQNFHETLQTLSQLIIEFDSGELAGEILNITHSPSYQDYQKITKQLHHFLINSYSEQPDDISNKDLNDPKRFIFFNEFINCNCEKIWLSILHRVRLPGITKPSWQTASQFYQQTVGVAAIKKAVTLVDLKKPTNLMQFRAYHQISEIFVKLINKWLNLAVEKIADDTHLNLHAEVSHVMLSNKLLTMVNMNVKPIIRTLTPKDYAAIRPALGITSGSHSYNLRKQLFNQIYPALVRATRLRLANFAEQVMDDDDQIYIITKNKLKNKNNKILTSLLRELVFTHQHIRTWRDDHIQFIKTQIGISAFEQTPMASISGAPNAAALAHQYRSVHERDPIIPIYRAVLGKNPAPTHTLLESDGFDEHMAQLTAKAGTNVYANIQKRVSKKNQIKH
jgi:hypothetical protein